MSNPFLSRLEKATRLHVQQLHEGWELLGLETRNKYRIYDADMESLAYAAEVSTGIIGTLLRLLLRHWRTFEIHIFDNERTLLYRAKFPFRFFFKTLILEDASGNKIGELQQRFGLFYKKFDLHRAQGRRIATIRSPLFRLWTFEVKSGFRSLGSIEKKWSGMISEFFTDKDNFLVTYSEEADLELRGLMLATTLMVDIVYFENNRGSNILDLGD